MCVLNSSGKLKLQRAEVKKVVEFEYLDQKSR